MRTIFILFLVMCLAGNGWTQTTTLPLPPSGLKYKLNYTVEETTFHMAPEGGPGSGLSQLDMDKLRTLRIVKQVERRITEDNHHASTIVIMNPEEAYSEFPRKIGRIEINQAGMQIYGVDNALYTSMPADSAYQADYTAMRNRHINGDIQIMTIFPSHPNAQGIQNIQAQGGIVTSLSNGAWQINIAGVTTLFEPAALRITTTRFEGAQPQETLIQKYGYTAQGIYAPLEEMTKRKVIRPSGACMEDVVRKRYSNYVVAIASNERNYNSNQADVESIFIRPNPTGDFLNIIPGKEVLLGSFLQIYDVMGKLVHEAPVTEPGVEINIPLSGVQDGIYFVRLQMKTGYQSLKFVKKSN
ncbi:MAG: T9SS type A sorting domain-containing protein [Saprospiraceae bacterium]|nr:T9SS type A sorting domain-containing protein [Saprospiraceae bacterium]